MILRATSRVTNLPDGEAIKVPRRGMGELYRVENEEKSTED